MTVRKHFETIYYIQTDTNI